MHFAGMSSLKRDNYINELSYEKDFFSPYAACRTVCVRFAGPSTLDRF